MTIQVQGAGPVALTDSNGNHLTIALSALVLTKGSLEASRWTTKPAGAPDPTKWLAYLLETGGLTTVTEAPALAFGLMAAKPGGWGNGITAAITKLGPSIADPIGDNTVDIEVDVVNTYSKVGPGDLAKRLGTTTAEATGLVFIDPATPPAMPTALPETPFPNPPVIDVVNAAGPAFTLKAIDTAAPDKFTIEITAIDDAAKTFDLIVRWTLKVAAVKLSGLDAAFDNIIVSGPQALVPAVGSVSFAGGSDPNGADPGSSAEAAVFSD